MKKLIKIFTTAMSLLLVVGAVGVSAANYTPIPGTETELTKYLVVNEDAEIPNAEFEFTVSAGQAAEATETTVKVWAGVTPALVKVNGELETGTVEFVAGEEATSANAVNALGQTKAEGKKAAKKTIALDFSGVEFTEPGVYRYLVTETAPTAPIKAVDSRITTVDVYVEDVNGVLVLKEYVAYEGNVANVGPLNDLHPWLAENPMPTEPVEPIAPVEPDQADFQLPNDGGDDVEAFEDAHAEWELAYEEWEIAHADWEAAMEQYEVDMELWAEAYEEALGVVPNTAEAGEKDDKFVNELASANIEFGKEVTGNQGSKDQWFKFTLELSNLGENTVLTLDMSKAENGVTHENTATSYSKTTMDAANQRDDDKDSVNKFFAVIPDIVFNALSTEEKAVFLSVEEIEVPIVENEEVIETRIAYRVEFADADTRGAFNTAHTFDPTDMPEAYLLTLITEDDEEVAPKEGQQIIADESGNATVEVYLHDGMYVLLKGLPEGAIYTLTEENAAGYEKIEKITQAVNGTRAYEDELSGTIGEKMETKPEYWTYDGQEFATLAEANAAAVQAGEEMPAEGELASGVEYHPAVEVKAVDQDIYTGYTNNREGVIPTGVLVSSIGGISLVALAGAGIYLSRRKREED